MNFILNTNVAFVVLGIAFLITILALLAPGTGLLEIAALISLIISGYSVANLPVNTWAIALLLVGVVSVIVFLRRTSQWYFIAGSIIMLIVGMVFVFRGENIILGVDPLLAVIVAVGMGAFIWIIGRNTSEAFHQRPHRDLNRLVGMTGSATTDITKNGSVYVDGENWSAISDEPISAGSQVIVQQRKGLVLKVEFVKETKKKNKA